MKVGFVALACAVAGILFAVGYNAYLFGWVGTPNPVLFRDMPEPKETSTGHRPNAHVAQPLHDFGTIQGGESGSHEFEITNQGESTLTLKKGKSSCKCTISKLPVTKLMPGESTKVLVTWKTSTSRPGKFRQTASILTNDPKNQNITFTVSGEISVLLRAKPPSVDFANMVQTDTKTVEFNLLSQHLVISQLAVESFEFERPETAKYFDVVFEPLERERLTQLDKNATSGVVGKITLSGIREGLEPFPLGYIRQWLKVTTNIHEVEPVKVSLRGTVVGEFDIKGGGYDSNRKELNLRSLQPNIGLTRKLTVYVRGPEWEKVQLDIESVTPAWINVELAEPTKREDLKQQAIALTVTIDKDAEVFTLSEDGPKKLGHIVLKTNHSKIKQIDIPVRLNVPAQPATGTKPAEKKPAAS